MNGSKWAKTCKTTGYCLLGTDHMYIRLKMLKNKTVSLKFRGQIDTKTNDPLKTVLLV